jgi:translation elongation factor EF-G
MERTLQVLDYAVLVISGADGVQGHTQTLWRLLARYEVPTFIFVNKMDQNGTDRRALMEEIRQRLGDSCIDFSEEAGKHVTILASTGSAAEHIGGETIHHCFKIPVQENYDTVFPHERYALEQTDIYFFLRY